MVLRGAELLNAVGTQPHHLAGAEETVDFVAEIGEGCAFGCRRISTVFLSDDDGRAAPVVACGDDAVLGEQEHGAGAVDVAEHVFDAFDKRFSLNKEQGDEFSLVGLAGGKLGKVHVLLQQLLRQGFDVVDLGHGDDGEAAQVGIDDQGLCVGVADDADARR